MEWYAKPTRQMRDPDYLRLPADVRGHHDALLALLAERERGPVLHGAKLWNRRDWDVAIRATQGSIQRLCIAGLAEWRGDDLHVTGYDMEGESRISKARESGRAGAKSRWSGVGDHNGVGTGDPSGDPNGVGSRGGNRGADARDETRRDETNKKSDSLTLVPSEPAWKPDFESLYAAYPLKRGKDKGLAACRKQIRTPSDFEDLGKAIANYAREVRGKDPQFTKYFSSFMSSWRDYLAPAAPATTEPPREPVDELTLLHRAEVAEKERLAEERYAARLAAEGRS